MEISTSLAIWVIFISTAVVYLYKYLTKSFGYWESIGVPCDKPYPVFGTEFPMFTKPIRDIDMERRKKYGRIYGTYFLGKRILNVTDPEIIKDVLIKDFPVFINRQVTRTGVKVLDESVSFALDDDWKRMRSIISPTFTSGKMRKMSGILTAVAKKLSQHIIKLTEIRKPVNIKNEFSKYSAEVLATCAFGVQFDAFKNPHHPFITKSKLLFENGMMFFLVFTILGVLPQFMKIVKKAITSYAGFSFFEKTAKEVINERRLISSQTNKPIDFLQLMIDAKDEMTKSSDGSQQGSNEERFPQHDKKSKSSKSLDENEIIAQCTTFLFGGHETVASALSYVAYDLALNPDIQERLLHEVDDAWEKYKIIDYDVVSKMNYLNAVISESLRLHTLALRNVRHVKEDYHIPNTDITIPKNALINIPIYCLHHDPEFFPNPEKFDPERFLPENKDSIKPYTYMPFSDGPRNCVAMRFALLEIKLCFAYLLRYIKFSATEETKKPLEYIIAAQILQSKNGYIVMPEKRRNLEIDD